MDVHQATVAEVVVPPYPLEEVLTAKDLAGMLPEFYQELELGPGQVDLDSGQADHSLLGGYLQLVEVHGRRHRLGGAVPAE